MCLLSVTFSKNLGKRSIFLSRFSNYFGQNKKISFIFCLCLENPYFEMIKKARNKKLHSSKISSPNKNSQEIRKYIQESYQALTKIHKKSRKCIQANYQDLTKIHNLQEY